MDRRQFLTGIAMAPFLQLADALCSRAESRATKVVEISIKGFDRVLLPREHGQLGKLGTRFVRRYPSRDHCMQVAAFFGSGAALVVYSKDSTGGVADWEVIPGERLRIHFYGSVPEVVTVSVDPSLGAIADVYRSWALQQPWIKNRKRPRQRLSFVSVASNPDLASQRKHLARIEGLTPAPRGVWFTQWRRFGFDTMYPDYRPSDPKGFAGLLADLRATGWISFPYINGLLFDERLASFSSTGDAVAIRSEQQQKVSYNTSMPYLRHACPEMSAWRDTIAEARGSLLDSKGQQSSGVYLDMLLAAPPILCWAANHGHERGDAYAWQNGIRKLLTTMSGRIFVEGSAEVYLDQVDHVLMHLYSQRPDAVPFWRLVYGDQISSLGWTYPDNIGSSDVVAGIEKARAFGIDSVGTPWMTRVPEENLFSMPIGQVVSERAGRS